MTIKNILGNIIIVLGILAGLFIGLWIMLVGGIVQIIEAIKSTPIPALELFIGLIRFSFAGILGWSVGGSIVGYGLTLLNK